MGTREENIMLSGSSGEERASWQGDKGEPGRCAGGRGSAGAALRGEGREENELGRV